MNIRKNGNLSRLLSRVTASSEVDENEDLDLEGQDTDESESDNEDSEESDEDGEEDTEEEFEENDDFSSLENLPDADEGEDSDSEEDDSDSEEESEDGDEDYEEADASVTLASTEIEEVESEDYEEDDSDSEEDSEEEADSEDSDEDSESEDGEEESEEDSDSDEESDAAVTLASTEVEEVEDGEEDDSDNEDSDSEDDEDRDNEEEADAAVVLASTEIEEVEDGEEVEEDTVVEDMDEGEEDTEEDTEEEEGDEDLAVAAVMKLSDMGYICHVNQETNSISVVAKTEAMDTPEQVVAHIVELSDDMAIAASDLDIKLFGKETANPVYMVSANAMPIAQIHLQDQANPESIRAQFLSDNYPKVLASAMSKSGVNSVLSKQNARFFVAMASTAKVAEEMKAVASAEMEDVVTAKVHENKERFLECVHVAIAGINKNIFNEDNDMKAAIAKKLAGVGFDAETCTACTEEIFAEGSTYFDTVVAKAIELMDMEDGAFKATAATIDNAGLAVKKETFSEKLSKGSFQAVAGVGCSAQPVAVTASAQAPKKPLSFRPISSLI